MSALHELIEAGNDIQRLRELLEGGEDPNSKDGGGRTPLHIAVLKSQRNPEDTDEILVAVRVLINFGVDVDMGDNIGCTPLHFAVMCRNYKMVELLLASAADVNRKDYRGLAPLHVATTTCNFRQMEDTFYEPDLEVVILLLSYNPDLDIRNQDNETPLMLAARKGNLPIVRELLKKRASVNLQNSFGDSALHYALNVREVNVDLVLELSRHGGSFSLMNHFNTTPQDTYFEELRLHHPPAEVEKAKHVIKLFMLHGYQFSDDEEKCIRKVNKNNKSCKFLRFLKLCDREIQRMCRDRPVPQHCVFTVAMKGAFSRYFENRHIPYVLYNKVLEKLLEGEYPMYRDVIIAGFCRSYMRRQFCERCNKDVTGIEFFDFYILYLISRFLSHLEMLNLMIACYVKKTDSSPPLPSSWYSTSCSIS